MGTRTIHAINIYSSQAIIFRRKYTIIHTMFQINNQTLSLPSNSEVQPSKCLTQSNFLSRRPYLSQ